MARVLHKWDFRESQKASEEVGKTKVGKECKLMAIVEEKGLPIALRVSRANPHEVNLVETTLEECLASTYPKQLIGDQAYDSDELDKRLAEKGIEMIAPPRRCRHKARTQDSRKLRKYRRRWKVEQVTFRRLVVGLERHMANFVGFVHLTWILILLKRLL